MTVLPVPGDSKRRHHDAPDPFTHVLANAQHRVFIEADGFVTECYEWEVPCDPEDMAELAKQPGWEDIA